MEQHEVRAGYQLGVPAPWEPHRPGESRPVPHPQSLAGLGIPGPDQGYALELATRFEDCLGLEPDERAEDVLAGAVAIAMRRAALFGRAPVLGDIELALSIFKYLIGDEGTWASADLVVWRREHFAGAAHDYWRRRSLADLIPEATLRLKPAAALERLESEPGRWRETVGA
jgi:hypothetical protein